ncbi:MAG: C40 family peptidase [Candidatus Micrarchaeota archaeon]|nr:C40 family peptidase [Candidatus Micrarchaeota archaeon]
MRGKGDRRRSVFILSSIFVVLALYNVSTHQLLGAQSSYSPNSTIQDTGNVTYNYGNATITPLVASGPNYCGAVSCSGAPAYGSGKSSVSESCSFSTCYDHATSTFSKSSGSSTDTSPASKVSKYNINNNGWLITCPSSPETHPQDQSWIDTEIYSFIAGNGCQASTSSLKTTFQFQATSSASSSQLATTQVTLQVNNPADVGIRELTFSPQVDGFVSTAFSNLSYIFKHFPTEAQSVSWYWYGKYANFFNVNPADVPPLYIGPVPLTYTDPSTQCTYNYDYYSKTVLDSIQNTYIPFTEVLPPDVNYPIQGVQSSGQSPPYTAPDSPSKTATFPANVYPYFIQQFNITNAAVPPNSLDFNATYDVYGPWSYYSPYNSIEPFPLDSNSLLYVGYDSNLVSFMRDTSAPKVNYHNAMQSNTIGANTQQQANIVYGISGSGGGSVSGGSCPSQDYNGDQATALSFDQVVGCAQQAGFSGTDLEIIVSIAYAESSFHPGECYGGQSPCPSGVPAGLLQTGSSTGDTSGYSTGSCPTGGSDWWYNPACEMQFAYVYINDPVNTNCPGPVTGHKFCYWQTYGDPAAGQPIGSYCKYMPVGYVGDNCPAGQARDAAGWWSGSGVSASPSPSPSALANPDSVAGIASGYVFALIGSFSGTPSQGSQQTQQQSGSTSDIVAAALTQIGVPYCYGGETPKGQDPFCKNAYTTSTSGSFDCSGLVQWAAQQAGFTLQRTSEDQWNEVTHIQQSDTVPGDLIFFAISGDPSAVPNHVAICANAGCTQMIEAPYTSQYVREVPISADCGSGCSVYGYGRVSGATPSGSVSVSTGSGSGEIDVLKVVNHGYYNTSQYQPSSVSYASSSSPTPPFPVQSAKNTWDQNWKSYWDNVIQLQNGETYLVRSIPISEIASAIDLSAEKSHIPSGTNLVYQPYNITADNAGDIFVIGAVNVFDKTFGDSPIMSLPFIARITNSTGGGKIIVTAQLVMDCYHGNPTPIKNNCQPLLTNGHPDNIVTASPIGDLVFISGWYDNGIHVLSGNSLDYLGKTISLDYGNDLGSYGQSGADVNIVQYLTRGGLYGINVDGNTPNDNIMKQLFSYNNALTDGSLEGGVGMPGGAGAKADSNHAKNMHHVLGMTDVNGYLYVMDNWVGQLGIHCQGILSVVTGIDWCAGETSFDMLSLRVMNSTGVDLPINPTQFNDIGYPAGKSSTNGCSGSSYHCIQQFQIPPSTYSYYPPYGWVLSANISRKGTNLNLCSGTFKDGRCALPDASEYTGYFMPLGPHLNSWQSRCKGVQVFGTCFGVRVASPRPILGASFSTSFNDTIALLLPDPNLINSGTAHKYGEMLLAQFNPENYTTVMGPGGPPKLAYACYTDAQDESLGASGNSNPLSCFYDQQMRKITGPIYLMENPFRYTEGIGSTTTLTLEEYYGSAFSGTAGFPSALQNPSQNPGAAEQYINQNLNKYVSNLPQTINGAASAAPSQQPTATTAAQATAINAMIYGYLEVPFNYTYTVSDTYQTTGNSASSCQPPQHDKTTYYVTYTSATQDVKSKPLSAGVEAGDTYLKYFSNYSFYIPNISSITLPPTIITDILTNRLFGDIYVNQTLNHLTNQQEIVNAIMSDNYQQNTYTQGQYPGFSNAISSAVLPPCVGAKCAIQADTGKTASGKGGLLTTFGYVPQSTDTIAALFTWYKQMVKSSQVTLEYQGQASNAQQSVFGYRRMVYVFKDRFDNSIFATIDADTANITQINLTITPVVDAHNANLTTVYINGTAFWTPPLSTQNVPLKNGNIYVYYAQNLNFVDYNPTLTYQYSPNGGVNGKENAQLCAFGDNTTHPDQVPTDCTLANPIWQGRSQNAGIITYHPSYNAMGQCDPAPKSLLQPQKLNCNIYGNDGNSNIPALCPVTGSSYQQYCVPLYTNGTGFCTSEVGLMGIAKTTSNGKFSLKEPVCGYGGASAGVSYYGAPSPEPITVRQSDLLNSSDPGSSFRLSFQAFNYTWTPQGASKSFQIGELLLSFGDLNAAYLAAGAAMVIALMFIRQSRPRGVKRRA